MPAHAQFNGYVSASYGYHSDPLYNFEKISDQLHQGYLDIQYAHTLGSGTLTAGYAGGLMLFNTLAERNYLEHTGRIEYRTVFGSVPPPVDATADADDGEETVTDDPEQPADPDSVRVYMTMELRGSARYDKDRFKEFDNRGIALAGMIRFPVGSLFFRVMNDLSLRSYVNFPLLSNLTENVTLHAGYRTSGGMTFGLTAAAGLKYYTNDLYDTTIVQSTGKGKGAGQAAKKLLLNGGTTTSWQISGGAFAGMRWQGGSVMVDAIYRYNPGKATRYLAQYANTSMLSDDIYADFFSYEGPEGKITFQQSLPWELQVSLFAGMSRKRFDVPALDLSSNEVSKRRSDDHTIAELSLSRFFSAGEGMGVDLTFSAAVARNRSNDAYNDYRLHQVAVSVGFGF